MAKITDIHSIVVLAQSADTSIHTYTEIYGGSAGCSININGNVISMGASSSIAVWVKSVSGGTGCFLMGEKKDVFQGTTGNMSSSGPYTGNTIS